MSAGKYDEKVATAQHGMINQGRDEENAKNFKRTTHPEAQWFPEAGLGQFIHWDIGSVKPTDIGWGMIDNKPWGKAKVTPEEYWSLARNFKPDAWDPDRFLAASKEAGFRYAVFTTKHHSGFTMWPSACSTFGVQKFLPGVDFVGPYVDACRKHGLKVGLYYSPPDWYFNRDYMSFNFQSGTPEYPDRPHFNQRHEVIDKIPAMPAGHEKAYHEMIRGHVRELLTAYGHIDILWFDGGPACMTIAEIREMQPHIIVNPRMHGYGDLETPEIGHPDRAPDGWWELCTIFNCGGWGYAGPEYRSVDWLFDELKEVRSGGGNLLANTTPDSHGAMTEPYYERMEELKGRREELEDIIRMGKH